MEADICILTKFNLSVLRATCQPLLNDGQAFLVGKDRQLISGTQPGIPMGNDQLISPAHGNNQTFLGKLQFTYFVN